ncbi:hypothetical protein ABTK20_22160, partial [Acinetobacter baumannii]
AIRYAIFPSKQADIATRVSLHHRKARHFHGIAYRTIPLLSDLDVFLEKVRASLRLPAYSGGQRAISQLVWHARSSFNFMRSR